VAFAVRSLTSHMLMPTHHTLECAKSKLNPKVFGWLNGSFLLTESFVKSICLV